MNEADALVVLGQLSASGTFPTLTSGELTTCLASARLADRYGIFGTDDLGNVYEVPWEPETVYAVDDVRVPILRDGYMYVCSVAGSSGTEPPDWSAGIDIIDGTVTWQFYAVGWTPTHDMNMAAATAWELKAGKTSDKTTFGADGGSFNPQQVYDHCMSMATLYRSKVMQRVSLRPIDYADDYAARWRLPRA